MYITTSNTESNIPLICIRLKSNWWRVDKGVRILFRCVSDMRKSGDAEECTMNEKYYAERFFWHHEFAYQHRYGYCFEAHEAVTEDGYILQLHRVFKPSAGPLIPVILQHGLFQCSGIFLVNERDSLAFYLAERGYLFTDRSNVLGTMSGLEIIAEFTLSTPR